MIDLPTWPEPASAEPYFLDAGSWQQPVIAAAGAIRLDRLGDRHGLSVRMPPMKFNDPAGLAHGRIWISRLKRGLSEGVRIKFPQPDYSNNLGQLAVYAAASAQASLVTVRNVAKPSMDVPEGIYAALIQGSTGKRYLHSINTQTNTDINGSAVISISPRLRIPVVVTTDYFDFSPPSIEGRLVGDRQAWTLEMARTVGLQFSIEEIG